MESRERDNSVSLPLETYFFHFRSIHLVIYRPLVAPVALLKHIGHRTINQASGLTSLEQQQSSNEVELYPFAHPHAL